MQTYTVMREIADSWGLLVMAAFFVGAILYSLRPGSKRLSDEAASIPLKED